MELYYNTVYILRNISFLTYFLEYNCFTLLCQLLLYNKVNQLYIYIYPHIPSLLRILPTLPIPPLQVVTKQELISLCYAAVSHQLSILHLVVFMSMPLSHFVSAYPSPSTCPQVHSLRLHLYSCPAPRFFRNFFFQIPYICVSIWYLFFPF